MKYLLFLLFFVASAKTAAGIVKKSYSGHTLVKIPIESKHDLIYFHEKTRDLELDVWSFPKQLPGTATVRVSPQQKTVLSTVFVNSQVQKKSSFDDIQDAIDQEKKELAKRTVFNSGDAPENFNHSQFHNYDEISSYLDSVANSFPDFATVGSIGASFEKKDLKYVKIGKPGSDKKAAFINGCIHAREWLACASLTYIIDQLTTNALEYDDILSKLDVYVLPVLNPDGYVFSWEEDRLWRKTKSLTSDAGCSGVDANRNFNYHFEPSDNPCLDTFPGQTAASEVEVQALSEFLGSNSQSIQAYFDIHMYGQFIVYPFAYEEQAYPANIEDYKNVVIKMNEAIKSVNGNEFTAGTSFDTVGYPAPGIAIDYAKGALNIEYAFTMELSGDDFIVPEAEVILGSAECWAGILVVLRELIQ